MAWAARRLGEAPASEAASAHFAPASVPSASRLWPPDPGLPPLASRPRTPDPGLPPLACVSPQEQASRMPVSEDGFQTVRTVRTVWSEAEVRNG